MKIKFIPHRRIVLIPFLATHAFLLPLAFSVTAQAQTDRMASGEMATCKINVNNTVYSLLPNQLGCFDIVTGIQPYQKVAIEAFYPEGKAGEKVVLSIQDGGNFDEEGPVKILQLTGENKIIFNFQVSSGQGIYKISLEKGDDVKIIQLWVDKQNSPNDIAGTAIVLAPPDPDPKPCGNNHSHGTQANAENSDCSGDPFVPYTGNESRNVRDIEIWGAAGEAQMTWMRYGNSRSGNFKTLFGDGGNWNHSFKFDIADAGKNVKGQPKIFIHFPEGEEEYYTKSDADPNIWLPLIVTGSRLFQNNDTFFLQTENGFRYRFEKLRDHLGKNYYQLQSFFDNNQNIYTLSYDSLKRLEKVMEPAGRYFTINYGRAFGKAVIERVSTSDGRNVQYHYSIFRDTVTNRLILDSVYYGDGTAASYNYSQRKPGMSVSLAHAIDPRYTGTDVDMKYTYDTTTTLLGFIKEEKNGVTGEVMATLSATSGKRTVCYANGRVETFIVPGNELGKIPKYVDGLGRTKNRVFGDGGHSYLETETDALGRATTYNRRTIYGNPLEITHADGSKELWTRDGLDLVLTHTDELGRVTVYTRDSNHRVKRIDYPDESFETFTYNNLGEVLQHQRRNGKAEISVYDNRGLRITFTDAHGDVTHYTYDKADRIASVTDALGRTTKYSYNERGLLTTLSNADDTKKSFEYDEFGNRTTVTDELGHSWETKYDEFKRPVTMTDPLKRVTKYQYDLPGSSCGCKHDVNKPTKIILPSGKTTEIEYDVEWQKIKETVGAGTPDAATTFYEYDLVGNLVTVVDPKEKEWKTEYDNRNRKIAVTDPLGNRTRYEYDLAGNVMKVIRPDNGVTQNQYDSLNRNIQITDAKGQVTKMKYDAEGNVVLLTDPKNHVYAFEYDAMNRKTKMIYPDFLFEGFTYDVAGNLKTYTTRAGQTRSYFYDDRNREISSSWHSPYKNDFTPAITRTYDAASRLKTMNNGVSALSYDYTDANELKSEVQDITGGGGGKTVRYSYNKDGLPQTMTYPDGGSVDYEYTGRNQIASIFAGQPAPLVKYTYDLNGNRIGKDLENGTRTDYLYDDANRATTVNNLRGNVSFAKFDYGYDNAGRRKYVKRDDKKGDVYSYDATDQVTGVLYDVTDPETTAANPGRNANFVYDSSGNRSSVKVYGFTTNYAVNEMNQYTHVGGNSLSYYKNANLKTFQGWTYTYDAQNRMIKAEKGSINVIFEYDARNRCVKRKINAEANLLYYNGWNLIEERNESDEQKEKYIDGVMVDEILVRSNVTKTIYYHYDALGSVVDLTDKEGDVVEKYDYNVFGQPTIKDCNGKSILISAFKNRFLFTGREFIQSLGIYDYRNRMYSTITGRFLQLDPMKFKSNDYNFYIYVSNNPINNLDPNGLTCINDGFPVTLFVTTQIENIEQTGTRYRSDPSCKCNQQLKIEIRKTVKIQYDLYIILQYRKSDEAGSLEFCPPIPVGSNKSNRQIVDPGTIEEIPPGECVDVAVT